MDTVARSSTGVCVTPPHPGRRAENFLTGRVNKHPVIYCTVAPTERSTGGNEIVDVACLYGSRKEEALTVPAAKSYEFVELGLGFNSFGNKSDSKFFAQGDNRLQKHLTFTAIFYRTHKGAVDFYDSWS